MGWVMMSERELNRVEVLAQVDDVGRLSVDNTANLLDQAPPKPKVRTNSEKMGYKPNGRRPGRPPRKRASTKIVQSTEMAQK